MTIGTFFFRFLLPLLLISSASAATLPENGDFESGSLSPWRLEGAQADADNTWSGRDCFAGYNTRSISPHGKYAALLESDASLRTQALTAGEGFGFIAASALKADPAGDSSGLLWVEIIDASNDELLVRQPIQPFAAIVPESCQASTQTSQTEKLVFSSHYVSTRALAGRQISLRFRHSGTANQYLLFSLIDQFILFDAGEQVQFQSRPFARAGFSVTPDGSLKLNSQGSHDPDNFPQPLRFSWFMEGVEYRGARPCLESISPGNHHVILYVNDGHHAVSDGLHFFTSAPGHVVKPEAPAGCVNVQALPLGPGEAKATTRSKTKETLVPIAPVGEDNRLSGDAVNDIEKALLSWASAWSDRDAEGYVNAYVDTYATRGKTNAEWASDRQMNFKNKTYIKVTLSDIHIRAEGNFYRASFTQTYISDNYRNEINKELLFLHQEGRWKIMKELASYSE